MATVPSKQILPLLFFIIILSLSCLILFSLTSSPKAQIQTRFHQIPGPNPGPNFTFIIKVLTFNRLSSLSRCLNSLSKARYDVGDKVHLHIFIDHFQLDPQRNGSADLDQRLKLSKQIVDFVDGFGWEFGEKLVHYRTSNAGLQAQWLEAWWPASDHEFAFVVEDDLEVSPLYYRFLKAVILNYYYNASNFSPSIYGASLQRPRFVPGKHGNKMHLDGEARIFLYQLVGTWGQLLFPRPWKEFRLWYDTHKAKGMRPVLDGMVTTGWYKKMGEKIWTPWFIKFIHSHGYFNIYTNFLHERALSISHRDAGVNYGKTAGPDSYLLNENSIDFNLVETYPLNSLKWYDFCFRQVLTNRIVRSLNDFESIIPSVQKSNSVILLSVYRKPEMIIRNILCHFEKLNIQNYILIGPTSDFLYDVARRGNPVIDASEFSDFSKLAKSINFQDSTLELIKEILVKAYATKKSLELGYDTWLLDANTIPISGNSFLDSFDRSSFLYLGKSTRLLFFRGSSSTIWTDNFVYNIVSLVDPLIKDSVSLDSIIFHAVEKLLEKQNVKFSNVDDMQLALDISVVRPNLTFVEMKSKFIFWSSEEELDKLRGKLVDLDMWVVDSDFSCTGVFCHQS
ncbi:transferase [Striga asiatica]|uniref:Transferase n=1 Tax=Striga asiatica TaxID=4170 RepID=A0A5A7Q715_STRAF|nr:transferase [Striga asiatica]